MTTLKPNFHNHILKKKNDSKQKTSFMFEKVLTPTPKQNFKQDHNNLIEQIMSKNSLLVKVESQKNLSTAKNLPTFCEKYARNLCQKYKISTQPKLQSIKNKQISVSLISIEEQIHRNIFLTKEYFHSSQKDFSNSIEQLFIRLKQVSSYFSSKCRNLKKNDQWIEDQLIILEFYSNKKMNKSTTSHITSFFVFNKDIKSQTPDRAKFQGKANRKVKPQIYQRSFSNKNGIDSNLMTDNSPNLLSGFQQKQNDHEDLIMSFKPNMETSQNCFSTLKYSQSELNLNFSKNQQKDTKGINKQEEYDSPFSPVQPYRLHKLQTQPDNERKKEMIDKIGILLSNQDDFINSVTEQISISLKKGTNKQFTMTGDLMSIYSQSIDQFSKAIEKTHLTITEENLFMEDEWSEIQIFIQKDIQQMQDLLELQRNENDIKDKKFLQNLDMIQNELIQNIFAEKQFRKADEEVLTQVLTNLIESIQRDQ